MLLIGAIVAAVAGLVGFAVTFAVMRSAHRIGVIAEVNERSSHTRPTPSGGGVGIVAGGTIGAAFAACCEAAGRRPQVRWLGDAEVARNGGDDRFPLWVAADDPFEHALSTIEPRRAIAAGLRARPLASTARAILQEEGASAAPRSAP